MVGGAEVAQVALPDRFGETDRANVAIDRPFATRLHRAGCLASARQRDRAGFMEITYVAGADFMARSVGLATYHLPKYSGHTTDLRSSFFTDD